MNVDEFAHQIDMMKQAINLHGSPGKSATRWLNLVTMMLEELEVAIDELREQNEELRLSQHLMSKETDRFQEMFT